MEPPVPAITVGRFGLEQRCVYRHHDLYHEEVPELDLETAVSRPDLGAGCAVRSFLLLGDQNAGKSTMLHSFCREGDPSFMQLSSLLPVLSSSFINTRLVPRSLLAADADPDERISAVRDEMPFMDTDIARGLVMLTLENFAFFCNEFGIANLGADAAPCSEAADRQDARLLPGGFHEDTRFVAMQFVELGGDHLDRLLRFAAAGGDLAAVRAAEGAAEGDDAFWADMHEVLLGSMRLLRDAARTVYFVNCAVLFPECRLSAAALRPMLRKLRFLDGALGRAGAGPGGGAGPAAGSCEIMFYCSRAPDAAGFDAAAAWAAARGECVAFAREELGGPAAAAAQRSLPAACPAGAAGWAVGDEGLDLGPLEEVSGPQAHAWRDAEERAGPLLAFIREMLAGLVLPTLRSRLRLVGVHAVRNLADSGEGGGPIGGDAGSLCVPSIVRNLARLLQRRVGQAPRAGGGGDAEEASLVPHVAELILRCAAGLRHVRAPCAEDAAAVVVGRWVACADLADHLEENEARHDAAPVPDLAALRAWAAAAGALARAGVCSELAPGGTGLPGLRLELAADDGGHCPIVQIEPAACVAAAAAATPGAGGDVLFVTSSTRAAAGGAQPGGPRPPGPDAVGLPLDPELFALLTSESALHAVTAHLARPSAAGARFHFTAPEVVAQLQGAHNRLLRELRDLVAQAVAWAAGDAPAAAAAGEDGPFAAGTLGRLLHTASDAWQAQALLGGAATESGMGVAQEPRAKRVRSSEGADRPAALERLAARLAAAAAADPAGAGVRVRLAPGRAEDAPACWPCLRLRVAL